MKEASLRLEIGGMEGLIEKAVIGEGARGMWKVSGG